jgi:hypothetical protein
VSRPIFLPDNRFVSHRSATEGQIKNADKINAIGREYGTQTCHPPRDLLIPMRAFVRDAAHAQGERILDFHSDIRVQDDATMQVVETIHVVSASAQIRHGIYRDFPTRYADRLGNYYVVGLDVLGATRDDAREDFRVEDYANGKRIYLGRANFLVPIGEHNYTLSYTTTRQIGFFADHDELFWNVTGNGWIFPIVHSSATVRLPGNIPADKVSLGGYTGPQGSLAHELSFTKDEDGSYHFTASRPLRAQEGLTILLTWPKGFVAAPTSQEKLQYFLQDNRDAAVAAAGLSAILLYYVILWLIVGRDLRWPNRRTIRAACWAHARGNAISRADVL